MFSFLLLLLIIPMIGFAIDGAVCYWMKTKLSSSVDAATLAAARGLSLAASQDQLQSTAETIATEYFNANFQPGKMGTTLPSVTPTSPCTTGSNPCTTVQILNDQVIAVTVQATVTVPLYFLPLLGFQSQNISDTAQSQRRSANVMLVLDRSGSMEEAGACPTLISSAQNFVNYFVDGRDTLGLVTFQATASNDYALSQTFKSGNPSLDSTLGNLVCSGSTNTTEALNLAYTKLQGLNQPNALNVIVLFTDGQPDSVVASSYAVKNYSDTRYLWNNTSQQGSVGASSCSASTIGGGVLETGSGQNATGDTEGIYSDTAVPLNSRNSPSIISAQGCTFTSNAEKVRNDIAYLPVTGTDSFGDLFTGYKSLSCCLFTSSNSPSEAGQIRIDMPEAVTYAALNTATNQANTIRNSNFYIYTIGLGGTPEQQIDSDFLMRVANDPNLPAGEYNSNQPTGMFIYATAGSLGQAFEQIASQILHLSK